MMNTAVDRETEPSSESSRKRPRVTAADEVASEKQLSLQQEAAEQDLLDKTDCELVMDSLLSMANQENPLTWFFPRACFQHCLAHKLSSNIVIVEEELQRLRRDRILKSLYTEDLFTKSGCALMYTTDYLTDLNALLQDPPLPNDTTSGSSSSSSSSGSLGGSVEDKRLQATNALKIFMIIVEETDNWSFTKTELQRLGLIEPQYISYLTKIGFLRYRRSSTTTEDMFWLAHPKLGNTISSFRMMEQEILSSIRRMKYKELSSKQILKLMIKTRSGESQIERGKGAGSNYQKLVSSVIRIDHFEPYLLDLMGRQLVKKVLTPSSTSGYAPDYILRLE